MSDPFDEIVIGVVIDHGGVADIVSVAQALRAQKIAVGMTEHLADQLRARGFAVQQFDATYYVSLD